MTVLKLLIDYIIEQIPTYTLGENIFDSYVPKAVKDSLILERAGGTSLYNINIDYIDVTMYYTSTTNSGMRELDKLVDVLIGSGEYNDASGKVIKVRLESQPEVITRKPDGVEISRCDISVIYENFVVSNRLKVS